LVLVAVRPPAIFRRVHRRTRLCFEVCGLTDQGLQREANEDSFVVRPDLGLFVVADGVGRSPAGGLASSLAVREIERYFEQSRERHSHARQTPGVIRGRLVRAFASADRRVYEAGQCHPQHKDMLTTLAAIAVVRDRVVVAHIGDSRVYRLRARDVYRGLDYRWGDSVIERLTKDHNGLEDPARPRPNVNDVASYARLQLLTRVIGHGEPLHVPTRIERVEPDDTFLVCTDGLHGVLWEDQFEPALRYIAGLRKAKDPERALALPHLQCAWMVDRVKQRNAPDNVTVIVVRVRRGHGRWRTERSIGCVVHAPPRQPLRVPAAVTPDRREDDTEVDADEDEA
jgi:protein phosphatase